MKTPFVSAIVFLALFTARGTAQRAPTARSCTESGLRRFIAEVSKVTEGTPLSLIEPGRQVTCSGRALEVPVNADFWMSLNCDQKGEAYNFIFLNWVKIIGSEEQVRLISPSGIEWARHSFWSGDPVIRGCR